MNAAGRSHQSGPIPHTDGTFVIPDVVGSFPAKTQKPRLGEPTFAWI